MKENDTPDENNDESKNWTLAAPLTAQALESTQIHKYHMPGGLGFAAEDINNFSDAIWGRRAEVIGRSNSLNGADRIVNGISIQSKYYQNAADSIRAAFDPASGLYRYKGQLLEVPKDQYDACVKLMQDRIEQGRVPGYSDPEHARKIVRQGTVTYQQAKNIARAGNIDSIIFDAKTQAVTSGYVFAISFAIIYAQNRWMGRSSEEAMLSAIGSAIAAGSTAFITGVIAAQLLRTKAAAAMADISIRSGLKSISKSTIGRNVIDQIATGSLGKATHGAAAINHVSKLLRSNAITATVAALVTSTPDFYRAAFERSISWTQFTKNTSVKVAGITAGTAGWLGGAAAGAAIGTAVPILGTAAGGVAGGIIGAVGGGSGAVSLAKKIADNIADDDSAILMTILHREIQSLAHENLLTPMEMDQFISSASKKIKPKWLRRMHKKIKATNENEGGREYVRESLKYELEEIIWMRPRVSLPTQTQLDAEILALSEITLLAESSNDDMSYDTMPA